MVVTSNHNTYLFVKTSFLAWSLSQFTYSDNKIRQPASVHVMRNQSDHLKKGSSKSKIDVGMCKTYYTSNELEKLTAGNQCRNELSKIADDFMKDKDIIKAEENALVILNYSDPGEDLNGSHFQKFQEKVSNMLTQ